ncbi:MAG: hypothetical protein QM784_15800 [Polyangiaceae bacterium]
MVTLQVPPLRDRRVDIPLLVQSWLERFKDGILGNRYLGEDALSSLDDYDWPGNVRQLEEP